MVLWIKRQGMYVKSWRRKEREEWTKKKNRRKQKEKEEHTLKKKEEKKRLIIMHGETIGLEIDWKKWMRVEEHWKTESEYE